MKPSSMPKAMILRNDKNSISEATKSMREIVKNRYIYQKALLDEVVYSILYTASEKPLKERINFKMLDQDIKTELMNNGIDIAYHLRFRHKMEEKYTDALTIRMKVRNILIRRHYSEMILHRRLELSRYIFLI